MVPEPALAERPSLVPLRGGTGAALVAATVLASMAGFLDASVVNVAVPAIGRDLGAGVVALQWSLTGYLLTAAVLAAVSDADLGEGSAISDVAARMGGAVMIALVPALIGVQAGRGLSEAIGDGYRTAMVVLAGLCVVAAVISAIFVQGRRHIRAPRFAPPAPYHGCALPDVDFADRPLTTTAGGAGAPGRTSEPTVSG